MQKIVPKIGATVLVEGKWKYVGQITFKNGTRSYFKNSTIDINPVGSADIAKDKEYSYFFMKRMGYKVVPQSKAFFESGRAKELDIKDSSITDAYAHAEKIGFPVVVKPNSGSQGTDVAFAYSKQELLKALRRVYTKDKIALVQKRVEGKDYRIVVLDTKVISAYERVPLHVVGDGVFSIAKLLEMKQSVFEREGRDTRINIKDERIALKLKRQGYSMRSVLKQAETLFLLDNANLSTGGEALDVTATMHPDFKELAVALTRDMGLRLSGVDLIVSGDITEKPNKYWILEINASPGLDHYVKIGKEQEKIVEDLYLQILKGIENGKTPTVGA